MVTRVHFLAAKAHVLVGHCLVRCLASWTTPSGRSLYKYPQNIVLNPAESANFNKTALLTFYLGGCRGRPLLDAIQVKDVEALVTAPDGLVLSNHETADHTLVLVLVELIDQDFGARFQQLSLVASSIWFFSIRPLVAILLFGLFLLVLRPLLVRGILVGSWSGRGRLAVILGTLMIVLAVSLSLLVIALPLLVLGGVAVSSLIARFRRLHEISVLVEI